MAALVNREIAIPFHIDATGRVATVSDQVATVRQHLVTLLRTELGERVMRPRYGVGVRRFVFEPNNEFLRLELQSRINEAVRAYEPAATIVGVEFVPTAAGEPTTVEVNVLFTLTTGLTTAVHSATVYVGGTVEERHG